MKSLSYAFRNVFKLRWNNFVKIVSLSLGLAFGLIIFAMVTFHLSYNNFIPNKERIYQLRCIDYMDKKPHEGQMMLGPIAPAMMNEIPGVEKATRYFDHGNLDCYYEDNLFKLRAIVGDSVLFDVLDFGVLRGDPKTGLSGKNGVFISNAFARRIFKEQDPIGKILFYNKTFPLVITGVFREVPRNSDFRIDMVLPFSYISEFNLGDSWNGGDSFYTYAKLKEGINPDSVIAQIPQLFKNHKAESILEMYKLEYFFVPLTQIHLGDTETKLVNTILGVLASIILFITAVNFILITLSSLSERAKIIGVHKCNGAGQKAIFGMLLTETAVYIFISLLLSLGWLLAFSKQIEQFTNESLLTLFTPQRLTFLILVISAFFIVAAMIPARIFAMVPVTAAFRTSASNRRWWKRTMLFFQFVAVTFVVVILIIFGLQYHMFITKNIGYSYENVLYFQTRFENKKDCKALVQELLTLPEVKDVSIVSDLYTYGLSGNPAYDLETKEVLFVCRTTQMDSRCIPLLEMQMAEGSNFAPDMGWDCAIVNQEYVELMHWKDNSVGKLILTDPSQGGKPIRIVGVVKNFMLTSLHKELEPIVIHPIAGDSDNMYYYLKFLIKTTDISPEIITKINTKLAKLIPENDVTVSSYKETLMLNYESEKMMRNAVLIISLVILVISLSGLIGYLGYEIGRRRREIAIRKVNGAGKWDVLKIISTDIQVIALLAVVIGSTLAYFMGEHWLSQFAYKISLSLWIFVCGGLAVLAIVFAVVFLKTRRMANENPVKSLKAE